jgi:hypothetical protein
VKTSIRRLKPHSCKTNQYNSDRLTPEKPNVDSAKPHHNVVRISAIRVATVRTQLQFFQHRTNETVVQSSVTERPMHCDHVLIYCAPHLSSNKSRFIQQSSLLRCQQTHLVAKWGETGREIFAEISLAVPLS